MNIEVTLRTLKDLDFGKLDEAFKRQMRACVTDCLDRPGDTSARSVELKFVLAPDADQGGTCEKVNLQVHIRSKVPAHRTRLFVCEPRTTGALVVNAESPEDPAQRTLDEELERQGEGARDLEEES